MRIKDLATVALLLIAVSGCAQKLPPTTEPPSAESVTNVEVALPVTTRPAAEILKATFDVPEPFVAGYSPESKKFEDACGEVVVIMNRQCVEANELKTDSLPIGDFPAIYVSRLDDKMTDFLLQMTQDSIKVGGPGTPPIRDTTIAGHAVKRLPFYPAPYGDEAYVYIVMDPGGGSLMFIANRTHQLMPDYRKPRWGERGILTATNYDVSIEAMIKTIRFASR